MNAPILETRDLKTHFAIKAGFFRREVGQVRAVNGVSLTVQPQETLGVVGESGCGKSTLARSILRLIEPSSGSVTFKGEDVLAAGKQRMNELRKEMQMVFQDPYASLNPRMPVNDIVSEPLIVHGSSKKAASDRASKLLDMVGLLPEHSNRYPHEFSGGQRQRIGIARALALNPSLIVLDEPVSALDVSVQAQVINLLQDLQGEFGLSYVFIAHDLSVVRHISDRVAVMYLGRVVESGSVDDLYTNPRHPYTQALLSAVPIADPNLERKRQRIVLEGDVPSPSAPPSGCAFRTRCPIATEKCATEVPGLHERSDGHKVACHYPLELGDGLLERRTKIRQPAG